MIYTLVGYYEGIPFDVQVDRNLSICNFIFPEVEDKEQKILYKRYRSTLLNVFRGRPFKSFDVCEVVDLMQRNRLKNSTIFD